MMTNGFDGCFESVVNVYSHQQKMMALDFHHLASVFYEIHLSRKIHIDIVQTEKNILRVVGITDESTMELDH